MIGAVSGLTIFLTGATGFLGNRILRQTVLRPSVRRVIVLLRGLNDAEAHSKLTKACEHVDWLHQSSANKVEVCKGDLSEECMGLSLSKWARTFGIDHTSTKAGLIIYNGAIDNWLAEYDSLQQVNVGSTFEILSAMLQVSKTPRFVFVSGGYMSFSPTDGSKTMLAETLSAMPAYDQTKFICELLINCFNRKTEHSNAVVVKPGFIVGAEGDGLAQTSDALWRLIKSWVRVGSVTSRDMEKRIPVAGVDAEASLILLTGLALPGAHGAETMVKLDSGLYLREVHQLLAGSGMKLQIQDHENGSKLY